MLQNHSIDGDLNVVISQSQGEVEENGQLVKNCKKHREGSSQGEVDEGENEDQFPMTGYRFHSTPIKTDEKQFSGEIPK